MAHTGISTSCLYPMETELALEELAKLGIRHFEVHFSTFSELQNGYLKQLQKLLRYYGAEIQAVHPFYSMLESAMFFSDYHERRFADGLEIYKQFFHAAAMLGAKYLVFHGGQTAGASRCVVSDDDYIERYNMLYETGRQFGVTLLHENVFGHQCGNINFCRKMIAYLGDKALFTFDNKQAHRAGYASVAFAEALSGHIRHLHISDCTEQRDCLLPGRGTEDYAALQQVMGEADSDALWTIEVYRNSFEDFGQLLLSLHYLNGKLKG